MELDHRVCPLAKSDYRFQVMLSQVWNTSIQKRSKCFPHSFPENYCPWIRDSAIDFVSPYAGTTLSMGVPFPIPLDYLVNVSFILDHRQISVSTWGVMYQLLSTKAVRGPVSFIILCICFVSWSEVQEQEYVAQDADSHAVRLSTVFPRGILLSAPKPDFL